jgi:hypothetical protein
LNIGILQGYGNSQNKYFIIAYGYRNAECCESSKSQCRNLANQIKKIYEPNQPPTDIEARNLTSCEGYKANQMIEFSGQGGHFNNGDAGFVPH